MGDTHIHVDWCFCPANEWLGVFSLLVFLASGMSPGWVSCQLIHTETLFHGMHICCFVFPASIPPCFLNLFPFSVNIFRSRVNTGLGLGPYSWSQWLIHEWLQNLSCPVRGNFGTSAGKQAETKVFLWWSSGDSGAAYSHSLEESCLGVGPLQRKRAKAWREYRMC